MRKAKYEGRYYDSCHHMNCVVVYSGEERKYHFTWSNKQDRFLSARKTGAFLKRYFKEVV